MSLQELEAAVEQLPQEEWAEFLTWVRLREELERQPHEALEERRERQLAEYIRKGHEEFGPLIGDRRPAGLFAGQINLPVDFDDPLPEEILRLFEGE